MGSKIQFRAMMLIWVYDILKFLLAFKVMRFYGIDPWIFLFFDMVTVPTYIIGWHSLIASLAGNIQTFKTLFKWSVITFVSSTAPYFYAAWAGRQTFPKQAWIMFILILVFLLANLVRKICWNKKNNLITDTK
ncbi:MAG: hypothetical protein ABIJ31_13285 [Pseudomonadota bacterium]